MCTREFLADAYTVYRSFHVFVRSFQVCSALLRGSAQHLSLLNVSKSVFPHRYEPARADMSVLLSK